SHSYQPRAADPRLPLQPTRRVGPWRHASVSRSFLARCAQCVRSGMIRSLAALWGALVRWWRGDRRPFAFAGIIWLEAGDDPATALRTHDLVIVGSRVKPKWLR